jgi:hypothetical protein
LAAFSLSTNTRSASRPTSRSLSKTIVREKRVRLLSITIRRQFRDCEGDPACPLGNDCIRHYPLTPFAGAMLDYEYAITSLNLITSPVIDGPQYKPADRFTIRTVAND